MNEHVILVDGRDRAVGSAEKLTAHRSPLLHRAVSVFLFNPSGKLLLQRRAAGKYHSPSRWSNTCCGHPRPGEGSLEAAARRLREEMGILCPLRPIGAFRYRIELEPGLWEHEYDHVFTGVYDGSPAPTPAPGEVEGWCWVEVPRLRTLMEREPERFTRWLPMALDCVVAAEGDGAPSGPRRLDPLRHLSVQHRPFSP